MKKSSNEENNSLKEKRNEDNNSSQKKNKIKKLVKKKKKKILVKKNKEKNDMSSDSIFYPREDQEKFDKSIINIDNLKNEDIFNSKINEKRFWWNEDNSNEMEKYQTVIFNNKKIEKRKKDNDSSPKKSKTPIKENNASIKNHRKKNNFDISKNIENKEIEEDDELSNQSIINKDNFINQSKNIDKENEENFEFKEEDFEQKLKEFFFGEKGNDKSEGSKRELEKLTDYYNTLRDKKIDVEIIKSLQENFISNYIDYHKKREEEKKKGLKLKLKNLKNISMEFKINSIKINNYFI